MGLAAVFEATVMATSVSHELLALHDLTCKVCSPAAAITVACKDCVFTIILLELESSEYPIAETGSDEQSAAVAESTNGDETVSPAVGLLTVTRAAGTTEMFRISSSCTPLPQHLTCRRCAP